jgi:hypothetical protein
MIYYRQGEGFIGSTINDGWVTSFNIYISHVRNTYTYIYIYIYIYTYIYIPYFTSKIKERYDGFKIAGKLFLVFFFGSLYS